MNQTGILDFVSANGLAWFFAMVLLVPLALLLMVYATKKILGDDIKSFVDSQKAERKDEVEMVSNLVAGDLKVAARLEELCEKLAQMTDAMWGNRDYTDRQVTQIRAHFDDQNKDVVQRLERIERNLTILLTIIKKRRTDLVKAAPNTEVLRKPRPDA